MTRSLAGIRYHDAHCHLYDAALVAALKKNPREDPLPPIAAQVVNGTGPEDWDCVSRLGGSGDSTILKAFGVHPWKVDALPDNWEALLREHLLREGSSVGEIGLDNWIEPRDEGLQKEVFLRQLQIANDLGLPPSIHCVRATGQLIDCLRAGPDLPVGFLVHGFSGSREVLHQLLDLGGYVSFSAYGAHPGRSRIREAIRACPADRLLAETDAPDMVPPSEVCRFPLEDAEGKRLQHPGEIQTAYTFLAECRSEKLETLAKTIEGTFSRLFGLEKKDR